MVDYENTEYDKNLIQQFISELYKYANKNYDRNFSKSNIERFRFGIVQSANNDKKTAVVEFTCYSENTVENLKNLSGEDLSVGDTVKVFYDNNNMKNAYIGLKQ